MLTAATAPDAPPTALHRAKRAFVYVRQSSVTQVKHHQESTQLQYRLVDRAVDLGWPRERIHVIDEDLGLSGASSAERRGFQTLIAEIGLGHAGLVVSLDASRLARNNRDWHQLLELCSLFGVLLADGERLYDPGVYHDRLLLGLSGIMSEAELHQIRVRLHQGERQKAARGELRLPLPAGLTYDGAGAIVLNPDEEVQARLQLVFAKFEELGSARAVMRYLRAHHLPLPVRPLLGPAPHAVVWREADSARVRAILQNPAYAGAYVYGRRQTEPIRRRPGSRPTSTKVAVGAWEVCLRAAHPGYIGWEAFMANQTRLSENVSRYEAGRPGAPRRGLALLQGIALCGRCGRRMGLRYSGPRGDYPVYGCRVDRDQSAGPICQEVRAQSVDDVVAQVLLNQAHTQAIPDAAKQEVISGPQKDQPHEQSDRRDDEGVEQPRLRRHRDDVAVTDRGDGNHREIEHVDEADAPVDIVAQPVAIEPMHRQRDPDQHQHQGRAPQQCHPNRNARTPTQPQPVVAVRAAADRRTRHRRSGARSASVLRMVVAATPASPIA